MDITILFKACVKTVRTTNKELGVNNAKTNILKAASKDPNMTKPREILKHLIQLHKFFEENKVEYLNINNYLSTKGNMNELDRDQIDSVAQKVFSTCTNLVKEYRDEIGKLKLSKQKQQHYESVIDFAEMYLKDISRVYSNAKSARLKRILETTKISKLESLAASSPQARVSKLPLLDGVDNIKRGRVYDFTDGDKNESRKLYDVIEKETIEEKKVYDFTNVDSKNNEKKSDVYVPPVPSFEDTEISPEEMQMFEAENAMLYNELSSLTDEVQQMEKKVVNIAELQELFTEKVLQQEKDIERISHVVAESTDNVKDANEQIRQAIQRNAGLRVWVLFFLLIMSFSLLFLDWYND